MDTEYRRQRDELKDYYDHREDRADDYFDRFEDSLDDAHDRQADRLRHAHRPRPAMGYAPQRAPNLNYGPPLQLPRLLPPRPRRGLALHTGSGLYLHLGIR